MDNFEQIRSHLTASGYKLTLQEPFVLCVELSLAQGKRHQAIFLSELQDDDGRFLGRADHRRPDRGGDHQRLDAERAAGAG